MTDPFEPPELTRERAEVLLERLAVDRYGAELIGADGPGWIDARSSAGDPLELKACALRIRDGSSRRRGRWLIRRESHETLLRERGRYLLGVYDARPEIVAIANVPAERVDRALEGCSWFECRSSDRGGDATQLTHSEVFPELDQRLTDPVPSRSLFTDLSPESSSP